MFPRSLLVLGLASLCTAASAATTELLRDLDTTGRISGSSSEQYIALGDSVVFTAEVTGSNREVWITDGTAAGTRMVTERVPGDDSNFPLGLLRVGSLVYFRAGVDDGLRLWRTDGTEAGTLELGVPDPWIRRPEDSVCSAPWAGAWNGRVWLFSHTRAGAQELWSTDGTVAGTRLEFMLPQALAGAELCGLHATANGLAFMIIRAGQEELWRTDGTLAGTFRLGSIRPAGFQNANPARGLIASAGGIVYLLASDGGAYEPWRSDGSQAGTAPVGGLPSGTGGGRIFRPVVLGEGIVFAYLSETGVANGLWRVASPTAAATLIKEGDVMKDFLPVSAGSRVFFGHTDGNVTSLWVSDGTAAGSQELFNYGAGVPPLVNAYFAGDGVLFYHGPVDASGQQLWVTNGIPGAQRRISDFVSNVGTQRADYALLDGLPVFTHFDQVLGYEPWIVRGALPTATADAATLTAGGNLLIEVKANDTDADSLPADLSVSIAAAPAHGTAVIVGGAIRYTPASGYSGGDTFQYRLIDELGRNSNAATVTITVNAAPGTGGGGGGGGGACCGSDGGGGSGGGGSVDLLMLALLTAASYHRSRKVFSGH